MPRHEFNRRLDDQAMILEAIKVVKQEMEKQHAAEPDNWLELGKIMLRLGNLYSLLDIDRLTKLVDEQNNRLAKEDSWAS